MAEDAKQEGGPQIKAEKIKPKRTLPTSRISFQKQCDLLRAWVAACGTDPVPKPIRDAADIAKIHSSTASLANSFFSKIGLLLPSGRGFVPSPGTIAFYNAHQWGHENAAKKLRPIIQNTWFGKCLLPKLGYASLKEEEALGLLGETAEAGKEYKPQLKMLLEYLNASGVIKREGNYIFLGNGNGDSIDDIVDPESPKEPQEPIGPKQPIAPLPAASTQGAVQFSISVKVDMAELAGWQPDRIAKFFEGISKVLAAKGGKQ